MKTTEASSVPGAVVDWVAGEEMLCGHQCTSAVVADEDWSETVAAAAARPAQLTEVCPTFHLRSSVLIRHASHPPYPLAGQARTACIQFLAGDR